MALAIATNPHSKFVLHAMNLDDGGSAFVKTASSPRPRVIATHWSKMSGNEASMTKFGGTLSHMREEGPRAKKGGEGGTKGEISE